MLLSPEQIIPSPVQSHVEIDENLDLHWTPLPTLRNATPTMIHPMKMQTLKSTAV